MRNYSGTLAAPRRCRPSPQAAAEELKPLFHKVAQDRTVRISTIRSYCPDANCQIKLCPSNVSLQSPARHSLTANLKSQQHNHRCVRPRQLRIPLDKLEPLRITRDMAVRGGHHGNESGHAVESVAREIRDLVCCEGPAEPRRRDRQTCMSDYCVSMIQCVG